jgi:hypothetical protein
LLGAALALPIILLVVIQLVFAFGSQREDIEQRTLTQAGQIVELADARLDGDFDLMDALATADMYERHEWPAAYARAREIAAINPHWRNVIVSDLETSREMFNLSRPYDGQTAPTNPAIGRGEQRIGGVYRQGAGCPCPCIYLNTPIGRDGR